MARLTDQDFTHRAATVRWLLLDVDGVLTDGQLHYGAEGELVKAFHVRDGLALRVAQRVAKLKLGILSGRSSRMVEARAEELDFDWIHLGSRDKSADLDRLLAEHGASDDEIAWIGDDLPDLPLFHRAGLSFAPADAVPEVLEVANVVLETRGGQGAVREMIERLLRARGEWQQVVDFFTP